MRKSILIAVCILLSLGTARAQQNVALTAQGSTCATAGACLAIGLTASGQPGQTLQPFGGATITVTANAMGNTLQFEGTGDGGVSWVAMTSVQNSVSTTVQASSTTGTGVWQFAVAGYSQLRVRMSTLVGGTSTVSIIPSTASAHAGGGTGGGAGSVTSVSGTANQIDVATGTTTPVISIHSSPTLPGTTSGTFSGGLTGNVTGNVSGTAGGLSGQTQYGVLTSPTTTTVGPVCTPPSVNGNYSIMYSITGAAAAAPTCPLIGLGTRGIGGTNSTDTILYSDNNGQVEYKGSVAVGVALPTPTTLGNANFVTVIDNMTSGSSTAVTVTPATWTVNGSGTLVIAQGRLCRISVDPVTASNWTASCADYPLLAGTNITITRGQFGATIAASGGGGGVGYGAGAGSVNVMTVTTVPAVATNAAGTIVEVLPNLANTTTTPTLNVGGAGAQTVTKGPNNTALIAGDYSTTQNAFFMSDGTHWQLLNPQAGIVAATLLASGAGSGIAGTAGTSGATGGTEGTTPTGTATGSDWWWQNSAGHCEDEIANNVELGCALVEPAGLQGVQTVTGADYTNSTSTASTVFTWTLPATGVAKNYKYSCEMMWESTAATLTGPQFSVNMSAAPTQLTAANSVQNTLAGADINGYISNTTTGSQNVGTGTAAGVTSTNYWARMWGTIEASPVAGATFIIGAAALSNTTSTLNIRRGSSCKLELVQ